MKRPIFHRSIHVLALAVSFMAGSAWAQSLPVMKVYKSATCHCCDKWIAAMAHSGFAVNIYDVADLVLARTRLGVPNSVASCHTARVSGYLIVGHVPVSDIHRLLAQPLKIAGLAVAGMQMGAPGMETDLPVNYETWLFQSDGRHQLYARHAGVKAGEAAYMTEM